MIYGFIILLDYPSLVLWFGRTLKIVCAEILLILCELSLRILR